MSQSTRENNSPASSSSFYLLCTQKKLVLQSNASLRPCEEGFVLKVVKMSKRDCCEATGATLCCGRTGHLRETLCFSSTSWLRWLASAVSHHVTPLSRVRSDTVFTPVFNFQTCNLRTHIHTHGCLPAKLCANEIQITVGHWIHFPNGNWYNPPGDLLWVVGHICPVTLTPRW